jgi:hypothetical protein
MGAIIEFYFTKGPSNDEMAVGVAEAAIRKTREVEGLRRCTGTLAECTRVELFQEIAEGVADAEERLTQMTTRNVLHIIRVRSGGYAFGAWCSW